jgi:hypothetical protein
MHLVVHFSFFGYKPMVFCVFSGIGPEQAHLRQRVKRYLLGSMGSTGYESINR